MEVSGLKYFLSLIALVLILEGMPYFLAPSGFKKWLDLVKGLPDSYVRGIGLIFMLTGITILYIALRIL